MITLAVYKRFEQPWRWGMLLYWVALIAWFGISALRQPGTSVTTLQILAVVPAFISMALFGLYTGEVSVRTRRRTALKIPQASGCISRRIFYSLGCFFAWLYLDGGIEYAAQQSLEGP